MIVPADKSHIDLIVDIYNSAIILFDENARATATVETFLPQLTNDINVIDLCTGDVGRGFMSYCCQGNYYQLTSLYVKKEYQKQGVGQQLLQHFEMQIPKGGLSFVKVLKNAPWSIEFYRKNGYYPITSELKEIALSLGLEERPWSMIMVKRF